MARRVLATPLHDVVKVGGVECGEEGISHPTSQCRESWGGG